MDMRTTHDEALTIEQQLDKMGFDIRPGAFSFISRKPTLSLPSVAEVIASQQVYQDGAGNVFVGITERGGQVIVDGTPNDARQAVITIATAALALHEQREKSELDKCLGYAERLAETIFKAHYQDGSPEWKTLPTLAGVLTQIDNMISGLTRNLPATYTASPPPTSEQRQEQAIIERQRLENVQPSATIPDIGREIAKEYLGDANGPFSIHGVRCSKSDIEDKLASLINQGVVRGAMEQWKKDDAIVRATAVTIGHERLTKNSMIVALAATEPEEVSRS